MLVSYKCFNCNTEQLEEDPFVKNQSPTEWFFHCRCPNCNYSNTVMCHKIVQVQIEFPPFKLN